MKDKNKNQKTMYAQRDSVQKTKCQWTILSNKRNLNSSGEKVAWAQLFEARLALNPGWAFSRIIFPAIFRASNHQLVDKKNKNWNAF